MLDHFGVLAPFYDRLIAPPDPARLIDHLALPAAGVLLDVGGGTGRVTSQLRPYVDSVIICDVSPKMLAQARVKGLTSPAAAEAEILPFAAESFERVLVVDAFHHFIDQQQAIIELARILKPGGRLVIEEPDFNHLTVKMVALAEKVLLMRSQFYYPVQIGQMMAANGLAVEITTDGRFAAWIIGEKS
ncbi:MAG: class I SAM-dependent methyltransferase [Candidatus Promineifilaceae bacterium]|nr:class I SAM-dependent methyltransferase [Candidatus Promineifilaceae bacterium]